MQSYFEDNPNDLQVLRHDKALHTVRIQQHLADVPDYIIPDALKGMAGITRKNKRKREHFRTSSSANAKHKIRKSNPLLSMEFEGIKKKKKR